MVKNGSQAKLQNTATIIWKLSFSGQQSYLFLTKKRHLFDNLHGKVSVVDDNR